MNGLEALAAANAEFERRLRAVSADDWSRPTPCDAWNVRALVNHVVGANLRYTMLLTGAARSEVETTRADDCLGDDPLATFLQSASELAMAFRDDGALDRVTHHRLGDRTGVELLAMRVLDVTVHSWDLARAIGTDLRLAPDVVEFVLAHMPDLGPSRGQGAFAAVAGDLPAAASPQVRLLHLVGRTPEAWKETP